MDDIGLRPSGLGDDGVAKSGRRLERDHPEACDRVTLAGEYNQAVGIADGHGRCRILGGAAVIAQDTDGQQRAGPLAEDIALGGRRR